MDTPRRPGLSVITTQQARPARTGGTGSGRSSVLESVGTHDPASSRFSTLVGSGRDGRAGRPVVLGHRGSTAHGCRENSVEAVLEALSTGADGVEVDVRLTPDGVLVCSHDEAVTTPLGRRLLVSRTPAAELVARADAGSRGRLATLPQVLTALGAGAGRRLVVEAKPVTDEVGAFRTARALAELLVPLCTSSTITVSSFDPRVLGAVRRLALGTGLRTALLAEATEPAIAVLRRVDDAGYDEVHLHVSALRQSPHAVRMAHQRGIAVTAWTVNGKDLRYVTALGVDAVITDEIVAARATVRRATSPASSPASARTAC